MNAENTSLEQVSARRKFIANLEPSRKGFVTNYPNFQHWKKVPSEKVLAPKPLNIYVHLPFCAQQCSYCYYRTITGSRKSEMDQYVEALCRQIEIAAKRFHLKERPILSVYFGGGTPTLLSEQSLSQITETLHKHLNLDTSEFEFTVEAEPVTMTEKKAKLLQGLGVNRISLGVQSLCDDVLKLSNRQDTEKKVMRAIDLARSTGAAVNIDLMSGLAGDTQETWAYSVKKALATEVESITVYKMELYANTQYYKDLRNNKIELPSDEQELEFMRYAMEQFEEAQYKPWCFFTFTKGGNYAHVHSPSIWRGREDYYPFGTSAFGRLGNWLFQNTNDIEKYISLLNAGENPISRGHHLTCMDEMVRDVVLGMKLITLDLESFKNRYGIKLDFLCGPMMKQLESEGFITLSDSEMALTSKGILHGDYVGKSLAKVMVQKVA